MERVLTPSQQDLERAQSPQSLDWAEAVTAFPSLPLSSDQVQRLSPAALAYIGDAVYELYVRTHYLFPPQRIQRYHQQVVAQVNANRQASHLRSLLPHLTEFEQDLFRRGRNAAPRRSKRIDPHNYQQATGLETVFGYLYLTDPQRLNQLLGYLQFDSLPEA